MFGSQHAQVIFCNFVENKDSVMQENSLILSYIMVTFRKVMIESRLPTNGEPKKVPIIV